MTPRLVVEAEDKLYRWSSRFGPTTYASIFKFSAARISAPEKTFEFGCVWAYATVFVPFGVELPTDAECGLPARGGL